jgi:uncharacterized membrane protein HdeD (DUF308 family)
MEATLKTPRSPYSWVLWAYEWTPTSKGNMTITVRAYDGTGSVQDATAVQPFPDGASGYSPSRSRLRDSTQNTLQLLSLPIQHLRHHPNIQSRKRRLDLRREISGTIGVLGGLMDVVVGILILQENSMRVSSQMMMVDSSSLASYFLLALGVIVLLTGFYVLVSKMMIHSTTGFLMILYGVLMLILGVGMIGQLFNFMMQGSTVSGITMIVVGLAMLYSGFDMTKSTRNMT